MNNKNGFSLFVGGFFLAVCFIALPIVLGLLLISFIIWIIKMAIKYYDSHMFYLMVYKHKDTDKDPIIRIFTDDEFQRLIIKNHDMYVIYQLRSTLSMIKEEMEENNWKETTTFKN
ncbi:hypothetical protein [Tolumonas auensis]|uniref:hypothetical protein n=1 Tax=Tolumonas auensis TaxID=43948 RepID=UPI002AA65FEC|nr:hypothetical protein [Tolumonas auensis]